MAIDDDNDEAGGTAAAPTGSGGAGGPTGASAPAPAPAIIIKPQALSPASASVKVLLYSLLTLLSVAFQSHGSTHIQGTTEGSQHLRTPTLTAALADLMSNAAALNGSVVSRAAGLVSDIISNDPSVVSYVHASGLAQGM